MWQSTVEEMQFWEGIGVLRKKNLAAWKKMLSIGFEHTHQDYAEFLAKEGIPAASVDPSTFGVYIREILLLSIVSHCLILPGTFG